MRDGEYIIHLRILSQHALHIALEALRIVPKTTADMDEKSIPSFGAPDTEAIENSSSDEQSASGEEVLLADSVRCPATKATPLPNAKCGKCNKRVAREGCTQLACLQCCDDETGCESHKKPRAHALRKEQVLAGTTEVQRLAAAKRSMRIPAGRFFREPGFVYQGDTVVIWDLRAYARNPKWKEEAVRKSMRRSKATRHSLVRRLRNSRKRFHRIMNELFLASQESKL